MRELLCGQKRDYWQKNIAGLKNFYLYDFNTPRFEYGEGFCAFLKFDEKTRPIEKEKVESWLHSLGPALETSATAIVFEGCLYLRYSEAGAGGHPHIEAHGDDVGLIEEPEITAIHKLDALFEKAGFKSMPPPEYYRGNCYPELP